MECFKEGKDFHSKISIILPLISFYLSFQFFSRIDDIPVECYQFMGFALTGIPADDFQNITLDNIDIVSVFGKYHGLQQDQMSALAEGVIRDWSEKVPGTLSEFDLIALGQILCHFNRTDIAKFHPDAYKGAAQVIGQLKDCSGEINQAFAQLAIQPKAFGAPGTWSQFDVAVVGNVISGLPADAYSQIPQQYINDMKKNKKENKSANEWTRCLFVYFNRTWIGRNTVLLEAKLAAHFKETEIVLVVHHGREVDVVLQQNGRILYFAIVVHVTVLDIRLGVADNGE